MGNKLGKKRQVVDEKYTRPQGLYQHKDVDQKKLKKLILDSKLAPCYPGDDDRACDLEECPICFLYYPSLNRSRCCMKGICTECFLQMKTPNSTRPTQCPFCKTSNYAVEYRGLKTKEEKGLEQIEEQRVIEAKIRMRQKELQDDEENMLKRTETSASTSMRRPSEVDCHSITSPSVASAVENEEIVASHVPSAASAIRLPPRQRQNREEDFDLDLEDIMVMEAIWLSIQENSRAHDPPYNDAAAQSEEHTAAATTQVAGPSTSSSSPSCGFACAIAALAESQQIMTGSSETSNNYHGEISAYTNNMPSCSSSRYSNRDEPETYFPQESSAVMVTLSSSSLPDDGQQFVMNAGGQWVVDHRSSEVAKAGTTYSYGEGSTDDVDNNGLRTAGEQDVTSQSDFQPAVVGGATIVPESFEEQMMLAMAVSLAEARAARRNTNPGLAWH